MFVARSPGVLTRTLLSPAGGKGIVQGRTRGGRTSVTVADRAADAGGARSRQQPKGPLGIRSVEGDGDGATTTTGNHDDDPGRCPGPRFQRGAPAAAPALGAGEQRP